MSESLRRGLVIRLQSGYYTVQTDNGSVICTLRGRLKQEKALEDIVAIGDHVSIDVGEDGTGVIEEMLDRQSQLIRSAPSARGEYKQVLLANIDQVFFVFSCAKPIPNLRMLDRFLVIAEQQKLSPRIVANKTDLVGLQQAKKLFSAYQELNYPLLFTSAKNGMGVSNLRTLLKGKLSAFAGPSGAGKSSLLNAIQPTLGLKVKEVKQTTHKGRHTTVVRELFPLHDGGYVADLPGLRQLKLWDMEPAELDGYFPELKVLVEHCKFNDCTHRGEPGCAVRAAVESGRIHHQRYDSYLRMRAGDED